jgi:transcription initiation factor TFIIIB Brf1 subunit/transcription initiation factor TFIIB
MKTCRKCQLQKQETDFTKHKAVCKDCRAQEANLFRQQQKNHSVDQEEPEIETHREHEPELQQDQELDPERETDQELQDSYVYLLTSPEMLLSKKYKIGKHTGTKEKLISRYKTYLVDVIVLRFVKLPGDVNNHEKALHDLLKDQRYKNSEWFIIQEQQILEVFDRYIAMTKSKLWQNAIKEIAMYNHMVQVTHNLLKQFVIVNNFQSDELEKITNNFDILNTLKDRAQQSLNLANSDGKPDTA